MTDLLTRSLREHADQAPATGVDLDAILTAGDRRVRRSRAVAGLAAAGVAGVLATGVAVVPGLFPDAPPEGAAASGPAQFTERRTGYATGSVIHWGADTFDVGARVASYVQTDDGFVFTRGNGDVLLFDGTGSTRLGRSLSGHLRADDTGSAVAWVSATGTSGPEYVVYDTGSRRELARVDAAPAGPGAEDPVVQVLAVDDGAAYWRQADTLVRYDLAEGTETVLARYRPPSDPAGKADGGLPMVVDVAGGRIAYRTDGAQGSSMHVGTGLGDGGTAMPSGWSGRLSPAGTYLAVEEDDEAAVYDTATGAEAALPMDGYAFWSGYGWESDGTVMVLGIEDLSRRTLTVDLLRCAVPDGACATVGSLEVDPGAGDSLVLPVGDPAS